MKIKDGFILREIAGSWVVVPVGQRVVEFNGLLTLNESGALLWRGLQDGAEVDELTELMLKEYDIDKETAMADVGEFVCGMKEKGFLCNE